MTTVSTGSTVSETLNGYKNILFDVSAGAQGIYTILRGGAAIGSGLLTTPRSMGPYRAGDVLTLTVVHGTIDYSLSDGSPLSMSAGQIAAVDTHARLASPPSTFGVPITGASEFELRVAAYKVHIATLAAKNAKAPPERSVPFTYAGNPYLVDAGNSAGGRDGSFANPYNALSEVPTLAAARGGVLFKAGGTPLTTSAFFELPAITDATATSAIVFGVYDPLTGARMINPPPGSATIVCGAGSNNFFARINNSGTVTNAYVAFDGLAITGANAGGGQGAIHVGGSAGMVQVTNCVITSAGQPCISSTGRNMFIRDCDLTTGGGSAAILVRGDTGGDTGSIIAGNHIASCAGIFHDGQGNYPFSSTIAFNTFVDCSLFGAQFGISLLGGGGAAQIYGNNLLRCGIDVEAYSAATSSVNVGGMLIENNTATDCEFTLQIAKAFGYGSLVVQYNTLLRAGSQDNGTTAANGSTKYGRCVEFYGPTSAFPTGGGVFRYNLCAEAFCFIADGSEGVGVGLDNNTTGLLVHGNIATGCEGQGIQCNRNLGGVRIFGNLAYDNNACARASVTFGSIQDGEIAVVVSPYTSVYNNTCVSTGRANQRHSIFVGGNDTEFNHGAVIKNNLLIGASLSAMKMDSRGPGVTDSHNLVYGPTTLRMTESGAVASAGTGTAFITLADFDLTSPFVTPALAGACDGSGGTAIVGSLSGAGLPLRQRTPVGWLHASF